MIRVRAGLGRSIRSVTAVGGGHVAPQSGSTSSRTYKSVGRGHAGVRP